MDAAEIEFKIYDDVCKDLHIAAVEGSTLSNNSQVQSITEGINSAISTLDSLAKDLDSMFDTATSSSANATDYAKPSQLVTLMILLVFFILFLMILLCIFC